MFSTLNGLRNRLNIYKRDRPVDVMITASTFQDIHESGIRVVYIKDVRLDPSTKRLLLYI